MAIRRDDVEVGGTVLVVTRTGNGAAVMYRRRKAKVVDVNRAACQLSWVDDPKAKHVTIPFTQLEADPEFLDAREQKRADRARRLEEDKRSSTLTYSLGEKLALPEPEPEPVSDQTRADALAQLASMRARDSAPPSAQDECKDEQHGAERGDEVGRGVGSEHAPEPAPGPARPTPIQRAPAHMTPSDIAREIARLEEEQRALLDMLVPIEDRLKALKRARAAARGRVPSWRDKVAVGASR